MENNQKKKLIKVRLNQEQRYIEIGDTLEQFKDNFKKEFRIKSNINDYILSCKDKSNRITQVLEEKTYQDLKDFIINYPKLIESSFIPKEKIIHKNSKCKECGISPIEGIKYICMVCNSYELCSICEKNIGEKHGHPLLKLRKAEYLEKYYYDIIQKNDENKQ